MRIGIYPGSFDPVTNGHLDIIEKAAKITDKLYVAIAVNSEKKALFSLEERVELLKNCYQDSQQGIEIVSFKGLLVDYCQAKNISFIIRGLRSNADFEYENFLADINGRLSPQIETVFFLAKEKNRIISSSMVKEIASYQGNISSFTPQFVVKKIQQKFSDLK